MSIFGKYRYIHLLIDYMHIVLRKYTLCETKPELLLLSHSVISKSLWTHGLQHTRLSYPSPTPRTCSNSCALSWWYHPSISSSVVHFSSCLQSFQHQGLFQCVGSLHQVTKVLELQLQHQSFQWIFSLFSLELAGLISLQSPRDLPNPRIESKTLTLAGGSFTLNPLGSPQSYFNLLLFCYLSPTAQQAL